METKVRLSEVGEEFGKSAKFAFEKAKEMGLNVRTSSSYITADEAALLWEYIQKDINSTTEQKDEGKASKKSTQDSKAQKQATQDSQKEITKIGRAHV